MSPLRHRMIEDMQVRNLSPYTQRNYLYAIARLARHFAVSPADLGPEELRRFFVLLCAPAGIEWLGMKHADPPRQAIAACRFYICG